jgi:hypothetical protein
MNDGLSMLCSAVESMRAGDTRVIEWQVPDTNGNPIAQVGLQIIGEHGA